MLTFFETTSEHGFASPEVSASSPVGPHHRHLEKEGLDEVSCSDNGELQASSAFVSREASIGALHISDAGQTLTESLGSSLHGTPLWLPAGSSAPYSNALASPNLLQANQIETAENRSEPKQDRNSDCWTSLEYRSKVVSLFPKTEEATAKSYFLISPAVCNFPRSEISVQLLLSPHRFSWCCEGHRPISKFL